MKLTIFLAAAILSGCASLAPGGKLDTYQKADIAAAIAIAQAAKDKAGEACFLALQAHLATVPTLPPAAGLISELERIRILAIIATSGWPADVRMACPGSLLP